MKINKIDLACRFNQMLIDEIGFENYAETIRLNDQEPDQQICHSHDFCDANMVMLEAVQSFDLDSDQAMEVMLNGDVADKAWSYWKDKWGWSDAVKIRNPDREKDLRIPDARKKVDETYSAEDLLGAKTLAIHDTTGANVIRLKDRRIAVLQSIDLE